MKAAKGSSPPHPYLPRKASPLHLCIVASITARRGLSSSARRRRGEGGGDQKGEGWRERGRGGGDTDPLQGHLRIQGNDLVLGGGFGVRGLWFKVSGLGY